LLASSPGSSITSAAPPSLPIPVTPSQPQVIEAGSVADDTYAWTFYESGAVRIDDGYLYPKVGLFVGLLPDDTLVGLFQDGLHIGLHVVPYPEPYLSLIMVYSLALAPLELLDTIDPDHDGEGSR
jgi:hypothetical protein